MYTTILLVTYVNLFWYRISIKFSHCLSEIEQRLIESFKHFLYLLPWWSIILTLEVQRKKTWRGHPDLNQGPLDLQSNALPLSYTPSWHICITQYIILGTRTVTLGLMILGMQWMVCMLSVSHQLLQRNDEVVLQQLLYPGLTQRVTCKIVRHLRIREDQDERKHFYLSFNHLCGKHKSRRYDVVL